MRSQRILSSLRLHQAFGASINGPDPGECRVHEEDTAGPNTKAVELGDQLLRAGVIVRGA
jgi:hypothetical protein